MAEPDAAQLQKIYVLRDFLGRGAGLPLLRASLARAVAVRAPAVWLAVLRQNDRAIRFYDKHGFAPVGPHRFTIGAQSFDFAVLSKRPA